MRAAAACPGMGNAAQVRSGGLEHCSERGLWDPTLHLLAVWLSAGPAPSLCPRARLWTRARLPPSLRGLAQEQPSGGCCPRPMPEPGPLAHPLLPAGSPGTAAPDPLSRSHRPHCRPHPGPACWQEWPTLLPWPHRPRARAFLGCPPPRAFTQAHWQAGQCCQGRGRRPPVQVAVALSPVPGPARPPPKNPRDILESALPSWSLQLHPFPRELG